MSNPMIPLAYETHIENIGWRPPVYSGEMSGTIGRSLSIEAIIIYCYANVGLGIRYNAHIETLGWQGWKVGGEMAGTTGQSLRLEAIQIELTGVEADKYSVQYRIHSQNKGWGDWFKDGAISGTVGEALRAECIEIIVTYKNARITISDDEKARIGVSYCSQIENIGWRSWLKNGVSGSSAGSGLRLEAIRVRIDNIINQNGMPNEQVGVTYRVHVQNQGWKDWVFDTDTAGTVGESLRLEAVEMLLTGADAVKYSIWYSLWVAGIGWTPLVRDGALCGSIGESLRVESIRVLITKSTENLNLPVDNTIKNNMPYREIVGFEYPSNQFTIHSIRLGYYTIAPTINSGLSKNASLTFTMTKNHPHYDKLKKLKTYIRVFETDDDGAITMIFEGRVLTEETSFDGKRKITCEGSRGFLRDNIQRPAKYISLTKEEWFTSVVNAHNVDMGFDKRFHVGQFAIDQAAIDRYPMENGYTTTLDLLESQMVANYGGYLVVRNTGGIRYLDYISNVGVVNPQRIDFGKNLLDLNKITTSEPMITAVIGVGKDGMTLRKKGQYDSDYVYDPVAVDQYGIIFAVQVFEDVDTWNELYYRSLMMLDRLATTNTTIDVNAFDCGLINVDIQRINIGDSVRCVSTIHKLDEFLLVTNKTIYLENPEADTITLGEPFPTNSELVGKQRKNLTALLERQRQTQLGLERATIRNLLGV